MDVWFNNHFPFQIFESSPSKNVLFFYGANWRGPIGGCFFSHKVCNCVSLDVPVEVRINGFYNLLINGNSFELLTHLLTFY